MRRFVLSTGMAVVLIGGTVAVAPPALAHGTCEATATIAQALNPAGARGTATVTCQWEHDYFHFSMRLGRLIGSSVVGEWEYVTWAEANSNTRTTAIAKSCSVLNGPTQSWRMEFSWQVGINTPKTGYTFADTTIVCV